MNLFVLRISVCLVIFDLGGQRPGEIIFSRYNSVDPSLRTSGQCPQFVCARDITPASPSSSTHSGAASRLICLCRDLNTCIPVIFDTPWAASRNLFVAEGNMLHPRISTTPWAASRLICLCET